MSADDACYFIDQGQELGTIKLVGFSGGEPTLFKKVLTRAMQHASEVHSLPSAISTNCSWAVSQEKAEAILSHFYELGLRRFQVSLDEFHEEWMPIKRVRYALDAAIKLGIKSTLICVVTKSSKKLDEYIYELDLANEPLVEAFEAPCTPVGYAAEKIPYTEFEQKEGVPADYCSMLDVLNILPNGSVQTCCGAPFHLEALTAGNVKRKSLSECVEEAEWDPVFNALAIGVGPRILADVLHENGLGWFMKESYSTACEACHHIFGTPGVRSQLDNLLDARRPEFFVNRVMVEQRRIDEKRRPKEISKI